MYAQLGNIQFKLLPVAALDEKYSYSFAEHQVIEGKPLLQFIGDNLDEANISLRFHFTFCDPEAQFNLLKAEAAKHEALPFLFATGKYLGRYIICEINKTTVMTADNGYPLCIEARLQLKEFVDTDPLASRERGQKRAALGLQGKGNIASATAVGSNKAACVAGQIKASAAQIGTISGRMSELTAGLKSIPGAAEIASQVTAATAQIREQVGPIMAQTQSLAADAQGAGSAIQGHATQISSISSSITQVLSGLPGPAAKLGGQIEALNRIISSQATTTNTLSQLAQGGAVSAQQRAQTITRILPG